MSCLLKRTKPSAESIIARIHEIDSMPHADFYSRWEADKQILQLTRQLTALTQEGN